MKTRPTFRQSLARGIHLFNRQEFYEAHEAWEEGWIDELSDDRLLLQGLIQVAAAFYKLQVGSPIGTVKLLEQGLPKLERFGSRPMGVDLEGLLPEVRAWRTRASEMVARQQAGYDPALLPRINYSPEEV
jgi:predicted metal-dependent hydrolase